MTELEFKQYIETIKDEPAFVELNRFIQFYAYNKNSNLSLFETIKKYLGYNHPRKDTEILFDPDYDYFYSFYEKYRRKDASIVYNEQGEIDLGKTLHLIQPRIVAKHKGDFTDYYLILSDGTIFISKTPLNYRSSYSGVTDSNCKYNAIIATKMAQQLGINTSENFLARLADGQYRVLSKFFLKPNEELIYFYGDEEDHRISIVLKKLEESLLFRKYPKDRIEEIKLYFLKQEFFAKLIGLDDQKADNTGLLSGIDLNGVRTIRITPMFDYDYSFLTAEKSEILRRQADNGETDIESLIEQYKNNPEFMKFVEKSISSFDMRRVYQSIFEEDGLFAFKDFEKNEFFSQVMDFVNNNIARAKAKIRDLQEFNRGEQL